MCPLLVLQTRAWPACEQPPSHREAGRTAVHGAATFCLSLKQGGEEPVNFHLSALSSRLPVRLQWAKDGHLGGSQGERTSQRTKTALTEEKQPRLA